MTEQESARSRTPGVLPFGDCVSRITELVSPQELGDDPYVGLEHLGKGTLRVIGHGASREVTSTKRRFHEGDILFGRLRPYLRKVARAPFRGVCSTDIRVFRARPGIDQGFLYHYMASEGFLSHACSGTVGTRMPRAHREHLASLPVHLPPLRDRQTTAATLDSIERTTVEAEAAARTLFALRAAVSSALPGNRSNDPERRPSRLPRRPRVIP